MESEDVVTRTWMEALWLGPYRYSLVCLCLAALLLVLRRKGRHDGSPEGVFRSYLGALNPQAPCRDCVAWAPNAAGITISAEAVEALAEDEIVDAQISEG